MSNIQTGVERMLHVLYHLGFLAGQIGRLITISTTPVIAGDSFFFVQAEDGIRDYKVTGVHTCALPIFRGEFPQVRLITREDNIGAPAWNDGFAIARGDYVLILDDDCYLPPDGLRRAVAAAVEHEADRSEERRVGEGCRPRWAPYHLKKK